MCKTRWLVLAFGVYLALSASAHGTEWSYVLGAKMRYALTPNFNQSTRLTPVFGLRYGRLKIGTESVAADWLGTSNSRRDPTVSYDFVKDPAWRFSVALRIQNVTTDESFDISVPGRKTLRSRFLVTHYIDQQTSIGSELTYDLLNRGDGVTGNFGASRNFFVNGHSVFTLGAGATWANKTHWRTVSAAYAGTENLGAGFGALQANLGYRYAMTPNWSWFANIGVSRPLGDVGAITGTKLRQNAQIGLLYFSGPMGQR